MEDAGGTPYEVRCDNCRVTHPVGTRRCIHCGGPIGRGRGGMRVTIPTHGEDAELDETTGARPGLFSPVTLLWIVILLGGYLYRSCAGSGHL